ncbi:hypothetical protein V2J09_006286 [Rumex salicifolius]
MAVASPASPIRSVPPSLQTVQSSPTSDASSAADPSDGLPHSLILPTDADLLLASRTEEYRQLFRLPPEVVLIQDFNCALQESILLQGHMYLFDRYICFYSNIFGFETKKIIAFNEVTLIRRAKTAGLFPNAIEIVASGKKHFFASFLSRDEAFKLIEEGWTKHSSGARAINDQDSISETGSQSNGAISIENSKSSDLQMNTSNCEERALSVPVVEERQLLQNKNDDNMDPSTSEAQDVVNKDGHLVNDAAASILESSNKWEEETLSGPEIPEHFTKVAESKFPIKVEDLFKLFFSDDAVGFMESFRKRCGDKDFKCTKWNPHEILGRAREVSFQHPIKVYFGAKCGGCKELQSYRVYRNSHFVVKVSQEVSEVPYADYFHVEGLWDVQKDDSQVNDGCILRVFVNVAFSKRTVWRSKIEQSTMEECREAYATWIELAHAVLKQKNLEESESMMGARDVQSVGSCLESSAEPSRKQNEEGGSTIFTDAPSHLERSQWPARFSVPSNLFDRMASAVGAASAKFCSFFKGQGDHQRLSIILFATILVLMQLSIVMLLSRPQQIYVVPQVSPVTTGGLLDHPRGAETMAWLEKRVYLLKDEMSLVEAQLERMRHEHILLKAQLKALEHLYDKHT